MEGAIKISNGDYVAAGYVFSVQGSHPAMNVWMENASVVFNGNCSNGGTGTLTVPLSAGPYNIAANNNSVIPTGNEDSPLSYEGSVTASVCGGTGTLDASKGATFSGDLESDNTANAVQVQFHYRDPNAKGKGNYDCSANTYAASVCGASWSGTAKLTPSTPPPCVSNPSGSGCQDCSTNPSASGCQNCSTNPSASGCENCSTNPSASGCQNCSTNPSASGCQNCSTNPSASGCENCSTNPSASGCENCSTNPSASGCSSCSTNPSGSGCSSTPPTQGVQGVNKKRHKAHKHHKKHKTRAKRLSRRAKSLSGFTG
jgi:hypothetical protein